MHLIFAAPTMDFAVLRGHLVELDLDLRLPYFMVPVLFLDNVTFTDLLG